jgi:branched-chain amino acid transport system substrate-binding protein
MKELPTDDPLFGKGVVRADGCKIHDAHLFEVKKPEESNTSATFTRLAPPSRRPKHFGR